MEMGGHDGTKTSYSADLWWLFYAINCGGVVQNTYLSFDVIFILLRGVFHLELCKFHVTQSGSPWLQHPSNYWTVAFNCPIQGRLICLIGGIDEVWIQAQLVTNLILISSPNGSNELSIHFVVLSVLDLMCVGFQSLQRLIELNGWMVEDFQLSFVLWIIFTLSFGSTLLCQKYHLVWCNWVAFCTCSFIPPQLWWWEEVYRDDHHPGTWYVAFELYGGRVFEWAPWNYQGVTLHSSNCCSIYCRDWFIFWSGCRRHYWFGSSFLNHFGVIFYFACIRLQYQYLHQISLSHQE